MMKTKAHYTRIIYWSDEDGKYLGKLPELTPHPYVSGQTVEEVNAELDQAEEALLDALGDDLPARGIRVVVPGSRRNWIAKNKVAKMRQNLEMGQKEFAALLGTSISTLKKWESGERTPSGAAAKLLEILERNPEAVLTK